MSKGSNRRPGTGFDEGWERVFGKNRKQLEKEDYEFKTYGETMAVPLTDKPATPKDAGLHPHCGFPFCECKDFCCENAAQKMVDVSQEWGLYDAEDDLK